MAAFGTAIKDASISPKSVLQIGISSARQKPPLTLNQLRLSPPQPKFHGRKRVMVAGGGQERLSYGLCVLQILIFLKGASRRPSFW